VSREGKIHGKLSRSQPASPVRRSCRRRCDAIPRFAGTRAGARQRCIRISCDVWRSGHGYAVDVRGNDSRASLVELQQLRIPWSIERERVRERERERKREGGRERERVRKRGGS